MKSVRNRASAAIWSLQTVYDLAAKRSVGLRFNRKNLPSKCASLRFNCNRQQDRGRRRSGVKAPEGKGERYVTPRGFGSYCNAAFPARLLLILVQALNSMT